MNTTAPTHLEDFLKEHAKLHKLKSDMVLFYARQRPTVAIWLKQGTIQINFDKRSPMDVHQPGLYFMDELVGEKEMTRSAKVLAKSEFYLVTRSELAKIMAEASA